MRILNFSTVEALSKGLNWSVLFILPLFITTELYGEVALIVSYFVIASTVSLSGQDRARLKNFQGSSLLSNFLVTLPITVVSIVVFAIYAEPNILSIYFFLFAVILHSIYRIIISDLRVTENEKGFVVFRLLYVLLRLLSSTTLLFYYDEVLMYLIAEVISLFVCVALFFVSKLYSFDKDNSLSEAIKINSKFGLPLVIHSLSTVILSQLDRVFIGNLLNDYNLGVYTISYILASSITFLYSALSVTYEPKVYKQSDFRSVLDILKRYLLRSYFLSVIWVILITLLYFFITFYGFYEVSFTVFIVVLIAHLLLPIYFALNYILAYLDMTKVIALSSLLTTVLSVVFLKFLIERYGLLGGALSTLFSYILLSVTMLLFVIRRKPSVY